MSKHETTRDPNEVLEEYEETLDSVLADVEGPTRRQRMTTTPGLPAFRSVAGTS